MSAHPDLGCSDVGCYSHHNDSAPDEFQEGDMVLMHVKVARANNEQALIEFLSMEGPFSARVPLSELTRENPVV